MAGRGRAITGWRADEVMGEPVAVIFTPEDRAAGVPGRETRKAAETGRAENIRWHRRKDGSRFFAEGVTVALRGPAGGLRGFGKVFRDATARKLAEERLTRDAMLLANVHDAVVMTDLDGVVTYWNEGAARLFGWTAEEMIGRPYADRFAEPVRSWVAAEIRARAAGSEWSGEYEDYRKDGSRVWIDARVTSIRDESGGVVGVLGVSHDISERKSAEEAIRGRDERLQLAVAIARMGTFEIDLATDAVTVNEPGRDIYGWADTRTTFAQVQTHFHPDDKDAVMRQVGAALDPEGPGVFQVEQRIIRTDGAVRWLRVRGRAMFEGGDGARKAVLLVGAYLDVTEQKEAEEELRDADRKKDDFIALLAHELRNPLAPIRNGLQVLRLAGADEEAVRETREIMERQIAHMVRLIDDLLDISRINRNKMELRLSRVTLAEAVEQRPGDGSPDDRRRGARADRLHPRPADLPRGRPDAAGPGVQQPAHQQRQVHPARREDLADRRAAGRRGRRLRQGRRDRHPGRVAGQHLRHVLAGGPQRRAQPPAAWASGWRWSRGWWRCTAGRSPRRAAGRAGAARSPSPCRWSRHRRHRPRRRRATARTGSGEESSSWTTAVTGPAPSPGCCG